MTSSSVCVTVCVRLLACFISDVRACADRLFRLPTSPPEVVVETVTESVRLHLSVRSEVKPGWKVICEEVKVMEVPVNRYRGHTKVEWIFIF